uniref:HTH_Tnp_Tc3_1 domain-containing protein n=1 Tax=Caenorhabditis japonica TaxID=281687 RepID=A0A8R1IDN8_CAEJA
MARAPFLTPAEQANVDVMHQLGLKLHEMPRQLGRSRNAICRYVNDAINHGKKQKLPLKTQYQHLPIGKRRNSRLQHYKELTISQPIANLCGLFVRHAYRHGKQFNTIQDLKDAIKAKWDAITETELKMFVARKPNRVIKVIQKNGGDTNYG